MYSSAEQIIIVVVMIATARSAGLNRASKVSCFLKIYIFLTNIDCFLSSLVSE